MRRAAAVFFAAVASLAACAATDHDPAVVDGGTTVSDVEPTTSRPFDVFVPGSYDGSTARPLVLLLHGYTSSGASIDGYLKLESLAMQRGFLYVHPDGTADRAGDEFWNATDACCNVYSAPVDDSTFLMSLITRIESGYRIDRKRVYVIGHSNGGFMAYRMACDHADAVAAIVSIAGATFADPAQCRPSEPVNVLQIHGTADRIIDYAGGIIVRNRYPGALTTVGTWAAYNGCGPVPETSAPHLDLDASIDGDEASVATFAGCRPGGAVELWTVAGGGHVPVPSPTFSTGIVEFLLAHPKP